MQTIKAKKVVNKNKYTHWFETQYTLNIYRGCSHGCIYCDSRSDCYNNDNFDEVKVKEDIVNKVALELSSKRTKGIICTGAMSDPYNPFEKKYEFTRKVLNEIYLNSFSVFLMTKSDLVVRDIDILKKIDENNSSMVAITITTFDDELCKVIEPNVCTSSERFTAIKKLSENGIKVGILLMPILPFINDNIENIEKIVLKAKECGASFILPSFGLTLRDRQRAYYYDNLDKNFKGLKEQYIKIYKNGYNCKSLNEKELKAHFSKLCKENGILYRMNDISKLQKNDTVEQISLF